MTRSIDAVPLQYCTNCNVREDRSACRWGTYIQEAHETRSRELDCAQWPALLHTRQVAVIPYHIDR